MTTTERPRSGAGGGMTTPKRPTPDELAKEGVREIVDLASDRITNFALWAAKALDDTATATDSARRKDASGVAGELLGSIIEIAERLKLEVGEIADHFHVSYRKK